MIKLREFDIEMGVTRVAPGLIVHDRLVDEKFMTKKNLSAYAVPGGVVVEQMSDTGKAMSTTFLPYGVVRSATAAKPVSPDEFGMIGKPEPMRPPAPPKMPAPPPPVNPYNTPAASYRAEAATEAPVKKKRGRPSKKIANNAGIARQHPKA